MTAGACRPCVRAARRARSVRARDAYTPRAEFKHAALSGCGSQADYVPLWRHTRSCHLLGVGAAIRSRRMCKERAAMATPRPTHPQLRMPPVGAAGEGQPLGDPPAEGLLPLRGPDGAAEGARAPTGLAARGAPEGDGKTTGTTPRRTYPQPLTDTEIGISMCLSPCHNYVAPRGRVCDSTRLVPDACCSLGGAR